MSPERNRHIEFICRLVAPEGYPQTMWMPPSLAPRILARNMKFRPCEGRPGCYTREALPEGVDTGWSMIGFAPNPDGICIFGRGPVHHSVDLETGLPTQERAPRPAP
jgi:hypothetical protein